jgi:hypothetical protein
LYKLTILQMNRTTIYLKEPTEPIIQNLWFSYIKALKSKSIIHSVVDSSNNWFQLKQKSCSKMKFILWSFVVICACSTITCETVQSSMELFSIFKVWPLQISVMKVFFFY